MHTWSASREQSRLMVMGAYSQAQFQKYAEIGQILSRMTWHQVKRGGPRILSMRS